MSTHRFTVEPNPGYSGARYPAGASTPKAERTPLSLASTAGKTDARRAVARAAVSLGLLAAGCGGAEPCTPGEPGGCADESTVLVCRSSGEGYEALDCGTYCIELHGLGHESTGCDETGSQDPCNCYGYWAGVAVDPGNNFEEY